MPTYEYKCTKCGHTFEAFQSIMDEPLTKCPKCKSKVRRVINGGLGVIFKGSGFYSTDNKRGSALTGGNGHKDKEKDKTPEKPKETKSDTAASAGTSSSGTSSSKEKTPAS